MRGASMHYAAAINYDDVRLDWLALMLDGAAALRNEVSAPFPGAVFQLCLVRKGRNLRRYLRRKDYPELSLCFDRLRKAEGADAGREALAEPERFVSGCDARRRRVCAKPATTCSGCTG